MTTTAQPRPTPAPPGPRASLIECEGLVRIYKRKGVEVVALQGLDLHVRSGELVAIVGASGSGKSTLLNILSGLDSPSAGPGAGRRARPAGDGALGAAPLPAAHLRLRVAAVHRQPRALPDRRRRTSTCPSGSPAPAPRRSAQRADGAAASSSASPTPAGGRPGDLTGGAAAAAGDRGRPGQRAAGAVLRRADRRPRHRRVARGLRRPAAGQRRPSAPPSSSSPTTPPCAGEVRRTVAIRDGRTASETLRRRPASAARPHGAGRGVRRARPGRPAAAAAATSSPRSGCATGSGSSWSTTTSRSGRRSRRR